MADLCLSCGEYVGQNAEDSPYCKCHRDELKELKEKAKNWDKFQTDTKNKDILFLEHDELMTISNNHIIVERMKNELAGLQGYVESSDALIRDFIQKTLGEEK